MTDTFAHSKVLNIPNMLTIGRIVCVPLVAGALYFGDGHTSRWIAASLFVFAALSDFLDGYLARIWQQQSEFGRMLDPIADKLIICAAITMLIYKDTIKDVATWAALIILCREILVSGLREYLARLDVTLHVTMLAKCKTAVQMLAIVLLLVGPAADAQGFAATFIGVWLLWVAAILTIWTGTNYINAAMKHALKY